MRTSDWYRVKRHRDGTFSLHALDASLTPAYEIGSKEASSLSPLGKCNYEAKFLLNRFGTGVPHWSWWATSIEKDARVKNIDTTRKFNSESDAKSDCRLVAKALGFAIKKETTEIDIACR